MSITKTQEHVRCAKKSKKDLSSMNVCKNMSSDRVCASRVH